MKLYYHGMFLLSACMMCLMSCMDDGNGKDKVSTIQIAVAPEVKELRVPYSFIGDDWVLREFLQVKLDKSNDWERFELSQIENFHYQDGTEYLLQVKRIELANPPADGSSVLYELDKILSMNKVHPAIVGVDRIYITTRHVVVRGDALTEAEKQEIENKIAATLPKQEVHVAYKFVYTDKDTPKGDVTLYTDDQKAEGTFIEGETPQGHSYTLRIGDEKHEYILAPAMLSKTSVISPYAMIEDVTNLYKADYPNLEQALTLQNIGRKY